MAVAGVDLSPQHPQVGGVPAQVDLVVAVLVVTAAAATAVGTSGVEMLPQLPRDGDGSYVLTVERSRPGDAPSLLVRNLVDEAREARIYAASARLRPPGGVDVGPAGSVAWLPLDEGVVLEPEETQSVPLEMTPQRPDLPAPDEERYLALVVEVSVSDSLVTQAVTVVRLRAGATPPVPAGLLVGAVVLLVVAAATWLRFGRPPQTAETANQGR